MKRDIFEQMITKRFPDQKIEVVSEEIVSKNKLNENGECFEHPGKKLEKVKEDNYFFRLSKYQKQLIELITNDTIKIIPDFRKKEMLSFLKQPL